jgi:tape measure domain-containing protein
MENDNGRIYYGTGIDNSQLRTDAEESKRILSGMTGTAVKEGKRIDDVFKSIGKTVAGVFAVSQMKEFAMQVVNVRGEFQKLEIAFKTMIGDTNEANALMSQLIKTAATTPFGVSDISNAARQLLAYGVEADKVNETLIRLGDIAAGLSIPIGDLAYLYGTTMVQGRMYTADLNQFLGRGIPLGEELAKVLGVAKNQVRALVEEGEVGFPEVEQAIINLTNEGSKFGGLMEEQSQTISGRISNIEDTIEQMFNQIGQASEGVIGTSLDIVSSLVENWETVGKVLLTVIAAYGTYKAAVLAVAAAHKLMSIWGTVQAVISLSKSVTSAKDAMLLFNMAVKTNPLGLVLSVVAAAATAFSLFSTKSGEAAEMTNKYGDSAAKTISRVETLSMTLNGLTAGTSTHKKVMDELNGILEEYGLQAIKEGDSIDMVNAKRAQAIELIKQEGVERQRANALEQGAQNYAAQLSEAQKTLYSDLSGANKELQQNAAAISTIIGNIVEQNITEIAGKTGEEYQKGINKIYATIQDRMRVIGISEETIQQRLTGGPFNYQNLVQDYIDSIQQAREEYDRYSEAVNKASDAERAAAEGALTFSEKVEAIEKGLQKPTEGVHDLYENIKNLMSQYSNNTIGFTIRIGGEIPKWMENMDLDELQRLAKRFTAIGQSSPNGAYANGKYFSQQQLLQRGADYATAAEQKQTEADDKAREAERNKKEAEREKKQREAAAKRLAREHQQIADETAERNRQIAEYSRSVQEAQEQAELDIRQQRINLMDDSFEKTMMQLDLNYDRLIAENEKRTQDMLNALADKKVLEWRNANPKATKEEELAHRASLDLSVADLTPEQQAMIKDYADLAADIRRKGNKDALDAMLADVMTYEQQRLKITEEYEDKRKQLYKTDDKGNYVLDANGNRQLREGVTQGNVDELDLQEQNALQAVDEQFAQREETYRAWCNEIANYTLEQLQAVLEQAEAELNELESSGTASGSQLSTARAKVTTAKKKVSEANAKNSVSPDKRSIKEWEDLYKTLLECEREFESIGDTVGGVAGEIISTAGSIMTSSLSMINGIVSLVNMSSQGIQGTATAAGTAIKTVEKASVILTIISAALQIAMQIVNLFNNDEKKQEEIEALQSRIDQLQWELDNADIVRLQENSGRAIDRIRQTLSETKAELIQNKLAVNDVAGAWRTLFSTVSNNQELLAKSAEKIADAYADIAYSADKALGAEKYESSRDQLENIAKQQLLIQQQINAENDKKDTDHGKIEEWERQIEELGQQAVAVINDMVEEIIGGSAADIASELGDAFFDAFQDGEDYAEAWGDKVKDIVGDVIKRMLVSKYLEEPLGEIFDKYKNKWFKDGQFMGLDAVIASMSGFANDLNAVGQDFAEIWEALPDSVKNMFNVTEEATREASEKGIATASQESVDELNGRATAIQGHTYSISENTKLLVATANLILQSVLNIEGNTDGLSTRMANVESDVRDMRNTVNDLALKGIRIKS